MKNDERLHIRLPKSLKFALEKKCETEALSMNKFLLKLIKEEVVMERLFMSKYEIRDEEYEVVGGLNNASVYGFIISSDVTEEEGEFGIATHVEFWNGLSCCHDSITIDDCNECDYEEIHDFKIDKNIIEIGKEKIRYRILNDYGSYKEAIADNSKYWECVEDNE